MKFYYLEIHVELALTNVLAVVYESVSNNRVGRQLVRIRRRRLEAT
jgi:hypothetical protein